jgi:hypothetical protein
MRMTQKAIWILFFLYILFPLTLLSATEIELKYSQSRQLQEQVIEEARSYLGTPYVYGGVSRNGVDCSGFVYCVFNNVMDIQVPRIVSELFQAGMPVTGELLPGDLVFFNTTGNGASHVGIFLGEKEFIHSASEGPRTGVTIDNLDTSYYKTRYLGARRIIIQACSIFTITLDRDKEENSFDDVLMAGESIYFSLSNELNYSSMILIEFFKDESFIFSKRIRLRADETEEVIPFLPEAGSWTVIVSSKEAGELAILEFKTGEPS